MNSTVPTESIKGRAAPAAQGLPPHLSLSPPAPPHHLRVSGPQDLELDHISVCRLFLIQSDGFKTPLNRQVSLCTKCVPDTVLGLDREQRTKNSVLMKLTL